MSITMQRKECKGVSKKHVRKNKEYKSQNSISMYNIRKVQVERDLEIYIFLFLIKISNETPNFDVFNSFQKIGTSSTAMSS